MYLQYTATSSPGGITGNSTGSPIYVYGLTPGQSYTFTVVATTDYGVSNDVSTSSAAFVAGSKPGNIQTLEAAAGNAAVTLTWTDVGIGTGTIRTNLPLIDYINQRIAVVGGDWQSHEGNRLTGNSFVAGDNCKYGIFYILNREQLLGGSHVAAIILGAPGTADGIITRT